MVFGPNPVRKPAVAGMFYPDHPLQLKTSVERLLVRMMEPVASIAVLVPHAGYIYSGATAGKTFAAATLPDKLIILCPNHTGLGTPISCWAKGAWETPLGTVPVNEALSDALMASTPVIEADEIAHMREHAIEVQLPFLQVMLESFSIVPVCVGTQDMKLLEALGMGMAAAIAASGEPVGMVVSSDMNHYEDAETNRRKDDLALDALQRLAPEELHRVVMKNRITMCGVAPAVAALFAAKALGADRSEVVDYTHSGMVTADDREVVSYAGVRIYKETV